MSDRSLRREEIRREIRCDLLVCREWTAWHGTTAKAASSTKPRRGLQEPQGGCLGRRAEEQALQGQGKRAAAGRNS